MRPELSVSNNLRFCELSANNRRDASTRELYLDSIASTALILDTRRLVAFRALISRRPKRTGRISCWQILSKDRRCLRRRYRRGFRAGAGDEKMILLPSADAIKWGGIAATN